MIKRLQNFMELKTNKKCKGTPEILAPAGGMEHLIAAVRSGANAVYLGSKNFNARRNAQNFDGESLKQAVSYCHVRNVKVYVTLNTLVFDREINDLLNEIKMLSRCAVDGIIVQDIGVASIVREVCPSLTMHASTQMSIHNVSGVKALEKLGFQRVVLARELSEKEIQTIANETNLELEVFVHGALCMSVSGQCYLSSMLGGRSGNRGLCAQPCRLNFKANGREYALSLKDLSLIEHLDKLKNLGIAALKIEGRMKRPQYVAAAVTACKDALNGKKADIDTLRAVFSRSGFTDGYFQAKPDLSMFGSRTKDDVLAAAPVLEKLAVLYRDEKPQIPLDMKLQLYKDTPALLVVSDGQNTVKTSGPIPETAVNKALNEEIAFRSLSKTGGTPFFLRNLDTDMQDGLTLPVSALNGMRKATVADLEEKRGAIHPLAFKELSLLQKKPSALLNIVPEIRVRFREFSQVSEEITQHAAKIILPVEEVSAHSQIIQKYGQKLIGELPLLSFPAEEINLRSLLKQLKAAGLREVIAGNLSLVQMAKELGFIIHGDYSLNILNSYSLRSVLAFGLADQTLSFETGIRQALSLSAELPYGIIAYGFLPLMTYRNCPAKSGQGCRGCRGCLKQASVTDRMQNNFSIICRNRSYSQLLNMHPLYLADKWSDLKFDFITLYFTVEKNEDCKKIMKQYMEHTAYDGSFTRGLYYNAPK